MSNVRFYPYFPSGVGRGGVGTGVGGGSNPHSHDHARADALSMSRMMSAPVGVRRQNLRRVEQPAQQLPMPAAGDFVAGEGQLLDGFRCGAGVAAATGVRSPGKWWSARWYPVIARTAMAMAMMTISPRVIMPPPFRTARVRVPHQTRRTSRFPGCGRCPAFRRRG